MKKGEDEIKIKIYLKQIMLVLCFMISILLVVMSVFSILQEEKLTQEVNLEYKNINYYFNIPQVNEEFKNQIAEDEQIQLEEEKEEKAFIYEWKSLQLMNPDIAGWIFIPESEIDYPVVKGIDNSFYLKHSFKKEENRNGCLFFDFRTDSHHDNQIIYGHNMGSGKTTMFSTLIKWEDIEWYKEHSKFYYTPLNQETQTFIIFAVIKMSIKDIKRIDYTKREFVNELDFLRWTNKMKENSIFDTGITTKYGNKIITLSTCDRREYGSDGRLIILAVGE